MFRKKTEELIYSLKDEVRKLREEIHALRVESHIPVHHNYNAEYSMVSVKDVVLAITDHYDLEITTAPAIITKPTRVKFKRKNV